MAEQARTPAVLATYACGRSLACCARPWKVTLQEGESTAIGMRLAQAASAEVTAAAWHASLVSHPPTAALRQPDGTCEWLDTREPACKVQRAAGFAALPVACQNFPRSVVATPDGIEIAWTLACPTAAALVTRNPQAWQWQAIDLGQFRPTRFIGDRVAVSRTADWSLAQVQRLRSQWWSRLEDHRQLLATLAAMVAAPLDPDVVVPNDLAAQWATVSRQWSTRQVGAVAEALGRLRDTGPYHRAHLRDYWTAWLTAPDAQTADGYVRQRGAALACATALGLQHAGLHDGGPVGAGIVRAALQTAAAIRILASLGGSPQPLRDSICGRTLCSDQ